MIISSAVEVAFSFLCQCRLLILEDRRLKILSASAWRCRMNPKACALLILAAASHANAATVPAGFDFLTTQPGTFFNFGPGIGQVALQGFPLAGSSPADTIMHRTQDATINGPSVQIQ